MGVIGGRQVGVRFCKFGGSEVESVARSKVVRNRTGVARTGVGARERPAAVLGRELELRLRHDVEIWGALHITQLPYVIVAITQGKPSEKNIGSSLKQTLSVHDPLAMISELTRFHICFQHRCLCFLDLQQQRCPVFG